MCLDDVDMQEHELELRTVNSFRNTSKYLLNQQALMHELRKYSLVDDLKEELSPEIL